MSDVNSANSSPREGSKNDQSRKQGNERGSNNDDPSGMNRMDCPLMSPPPLYSANDYGIETICYTPKLVKSLMHRKVIKISSGGVHNICIVESQSACVFKDVYQCFMQDKFTDVVFKGFYTTDEEPRDNNQNRQK